MVRTDRIRGKMAELGYTQGEVAKFLGISEVTMTERMKTGKFWSTEVVKIAQLLEIEDVSYFF